MPGVVSVQAKSPRRDQLTVFCCMSQPEPPCEMEDALTVTVDDVCLLPSLVL